MAINLICRRCKSNLSLRSKVCKNCGYNLGNTNVDISDLCGHFVLIYKVHTGGLFNG